MCKKEDFYNFYNEATKEPHNFLMIDFNPKERGKHFRKNFDTYLSS